MSRRVGVLASAVATTALAFGLATAWAATADTSDGGMQTNIVGGHAPTQAYPPGAFAAVTYSAPKHGVENRFTCTAAQTNGRYVRIAAHCVTDVPAGFSADAKARLMKFYGLDATAAAIPTADKQFSVRVGSPDRTSGGVVTTASVAWVHPGWAWGNSPESDDIALLKTDQYLDSYALPIAPRKARPGDVVYSLGWGGTEPVFAGELPTQIRELQRRVVPASKCVDAGITTRDICLDNPQGAKGNCNGDSGGAAVLKINGVYYDAGITSRGGSPICGATPDVYTSTPEFTRELYAAMQTAPGKTHGAPVR
ncbi:trypsin-like serine protease [Amycolatopsis sp. NEAU-NG30]|uniref:Trypsin-like serine protease n=1 Tax=Amycolatopsis melonis TaxID=3156488 RepID=A0ABV0LEK6_9PSEU